MVNASLIGYYMYIGVSGIGWWFCCWCYCCCWHDDDDDFVAVVVIIKDGDDYIPELFTVFRMQGQNCRYNSTTVYVL